MKIFKSLLLSFLFAIMVLWLGYFQLRSDFLLLLFSFALMFFSYFLLLKDSAQKPLKYYLKLAVGLRLLLLFSVPALSDDYFRFLWDGLEMSKGVNPYLFLPSEYINNPEFKQQGMPYFLFANMNSPDYYSVYPPVNQFVFLWGGLASKQNLLLGLMSVRTFIILAEAGTIFLLPRFLSNLNINPKASLLYSLNPLVIIELTGNLHFEALMIFFLLLSFWYMHQKKWLPSGIFMAFSIGTKLLPLMLLPFILKKEKWTFNMKFLTVAGTVLILLFLPFLSAPLLSNIGQSLGLYFQKFEFNAGIFNLIRWVGFELKGYDIIRTAGWVLALTVTAIVLLLSFWPKKNNYKKLFTHMLFGLTAYLLLSTTVHPWYIAGLVFFASLTDFRFPILWSGLVLLSYSAYSTPPVVRENYWFITLEYLLLFAFMIYEWRGGGKELKKVLP